MPRSKNIKRDEHGHPIVPGAETFGTLTVRPKSSRGKSRSYHLFIEATNRLARLMSAGGMHRVYPQDREQIEAIREQNEFARLPYEVKFHYYNVRLNELNAELEELEACGNRRKYEFTAPIIQMEIEHFEKQMIDMYEEIRAERRRVSND